MLKKKLISALSAAAVVVSMATGAVSTAFAKDTGISGDYTQGTTIKTFLDTDLEGYESITLNYEYNSLVDVPTETFGLLSFDSEWGGWDKTSVGQAEPVIGEVYSSTVSFDTLESSINTGKELYGFNLIADNFGGGSVKLNSVVLNDKQGQEATITGPWTKGTASEMTVTGDTDINVDANPYNIYVSGFSAYGFINPVVDVTVEYSSDIAGDDVFKEATLYYVDNYNTEQETWTPVEENTYKKVKAGEVTYSYQIDDKCHSFFACFDECTVKEIKIHDKTPDPIDITGSWTKGTESEMISTNQDVWLYAGADNIYVFNLSLKGYLNPTIEVTANYNSIPDNYVQAELYSKGNKIGGDYIPVEETGERTFNFDVSNDLTEFNVCFDKCTITKVKIYDNRTPEAPVISNKTASELTAYMGKAWNLGNALESTTDGTVGETLWNNKFPVSKPLFDTVKASGFDTVRIPVSYMDKIGDGANGYKIEEAWLNRVQEVVDLAINAGLLVVIDIHHDGSDGVQGKWIDISSDDFETVQTKFTAVWSQIADKFSGYDQRLMFESMNEIKISGQENASDDAYDKINALNQAFVTAVRNAGGKNTDRVLIIPGYNADINATVNSNFVKPTDNKADRLMLSVHYYDPYDFVLNENGTVEWDEDIDYMKTQLQKFSNFAKGLNMPVFIGEYGAIDKNNDESRVAYLSSLNEIANSFANIVTAYWDNGYTGQYGFALFDRSNNTVTDTGETLLEYIIG